VVLLTQEQMQQLAAEHGTVLVEESDWQADNGDGQVQYVDDFEDDEDVRISASSVTFARCHRR